jgi:hypothetical protein
LSLPPQTSVQPSSLCAASEGGRCRDEERLVSVVANRDGVDSDRSGGMMVHFICGAWYIFMRLYSIFYPPTE